MVVLEEVFHITKIWKVAPHAQQVAELEADDSGEAQPDWFLGS